MLAVPEQTLNYKYEELKKKRRLLKKAINELKVDLDTVEADIKKIENEEYDRIQPKLFDEIKEEQR